MREVCPSTSFFFFCKFDFSYFFGFFLSTSTRMRKIIDFKNNALKFESVLKTLENLNSFETMLKMLKNDANILKNVFFGFSLFFAIFGFFKNFIKKVGQKLGNNSFYFGIYGYKMEKYSLQHIRLNNL